MEFESSLQSASVEVRQAASEDWRLFGKFVRVELLGKGGGGEVWRAWDRGLNRFVALKLLTGFAGSEERERFAREAQMAARLVHPNIVAVHEQGQFDGIDFISMQYVPGLPLSKVRLPAKDGIRVMRDVARAVQAAHDLGVIHRDLKPHNIMVEEKTLQAHVVDFGLARPVAGPSSVSITGTILGTPSYMAPEQARGQKDVNTRADVYSLGATLYEVATGTPPFVDENPMEVLRQVDREEPTTPRKLNPRLPVEIEIIIQKAMEKDPARRYATAGELADDLDRHLRGDPIHARPTSATYRLIKRLKKQPALYALAALLTLAVTGAVIIEAKGYVKERWLQKQLIQTLQDGIKKERRSRILEGAQATILSSQEEQANPNVKLNEFRRTLEGTARMLEEGIKEFPNDPEMMFWMGRAHDLMWREDGAVKWYDRAVAAVDALGPAKSAAGAGARFYRGRARLRQYLETFLRDDRNMEDERKEALAALREDLQGAGEEPVPGSEAELVQCYSMLPDSVRWKDLREKCEKRARQGGRTEEYLFLLGALEQLAGNDEASAAWLTAAIDRHPRHVQAWFNRGVAKALLLNHAGAVEDYTEVLELKPDYAAAYSNRAEARTRLGDCRAAIEDCDRAIEMDPSYAPAYVNRGAAKDHLGNLQGALEDYRKASDVSPEYALAFSNQGVILIKLGQFRPAIDAYTKALGLNSKMAPAYYGRAVAKRLLADLRGAAEDYAKAIGVKPNFPEACLELGGTKFQLEDYAGAVEDVKRALQLAPPDWPHRAQAEECLREAERVLKARDDY